MTTRTMVELKAVIEGRRQEMDRAPFLRGLDASNDVEDVRAFVPHLYFYVFAFQDMLRLAADTITDPELAAIARNHRDEDAGHDQWFAHDVAVLDCVRDVAWVLGAEHQATRDVSYRILSEILSANDDRIRLSLPLVLEAAGSLFFFRVIDLLRRAGFQRPLKYFSRFHQQVEANHDIFKAETGRALDAIEFPPETFDLAAAAVNRTFDILVTFSDQLEAHRVAHHSMPGIGGR